jgi:ACS family hexuronate transporter-like MFS transporter
MWLHLRILTLIALVTVINYFDRSAISFAIQPLEHTFGITNSEFGWIAGAFGIGYLLSAPFGGMLVDRFGPVAMWLVSATIWSILTVGMGFASTFETFFILRVLLGIAEGVHFPCLLRIVVDWLPQSLRGKMLAIGLAGVPLSSLIGSPFLAWLIDDFGWKVMFYVLGALGLLWGILWVINFRGKFEFQPKDTKAAKKAMLILQTSSGWKSIISSHPFQISCFIYFAFGYTVFFALMWLPGYLQQTYGINIRETGFLVMLPWFTSSVLLFFGGTISDKLLKKTRDLHKARSCLIGVCMGASGILFLLIPISPYTSLDMLLYSCALGLAFAINAPIYALNGDLFPRHPGTAQGIMTLFFALSGIVAPALTGFLSDISGNFESAIYMMAAFSLVAAILAIFGQWPTNTVPQK